MDRALGQLSCWALWRALSRIDGGALHRLGPALAEPGCRDFEVSFIHASLSLIHISEPTRRS
eukprot:4483471-Prymnesium_polylepis.1